MLNNIPLTSSQTHAHTQHTHPCTTSQHIFHATKLLSQDIAVKEAGVFGHPADQSIKVRWLECIHAVAFLNVGISFTPNLHSAHIITPNLPSSHYSPLPLTLSPLSISPLSFPLPHPSTPPNSHTYLSRVLILPVGLVLQVGIS